MALAVASAAAQTKPDFSGEWTLNRPASTLSPASSGVQNGVVRIEHREPQFHYKATLMTQANPIEYELQFVQTDASLSTQAGQRRRRVCVSGGRWY
jgi:hypothetical protein